MDDSSSSSSSGSGDDSPDLDTEEESTRKFRPCGRHRPNAACKRPSQNEVGESSKKMKPAKSESDDNVPPEEKVKKMSLEDMFGVLYAEGHFSRYPRPVERQVVAMLVPTNSSAGPVLIKGSVSIGKSPSCDIVLSKFGFCVNISDHHATITYDRSTRLFELMNYSKTLTIVDNLSYSNGHPTPDKPNAVLKNLRNFLNANRMTEPDMDELAENIISDGACYGSEDEVITTCSYGRRLKQAFPGAAIIRHGSELRFGCIPFVFCTMNQW
ncbi:PHD finger protein 12 [Nilaparvata lugens]|uniref:PHD finger protein 12 n=1 Tax=Nilaparvata lugens TaxID=108931 RepID=UPI00193C9B81|nr:PHD finger protein 12 [Nilaparvata lugens]